MSRLIQENAEMSTTENFEKENEKAAFKLTAVSQRATDDLYELRTCEDKKIGCDNNGKSCVDTTVCTKTDAGSFRVKKFDAFEKHFGNLMPSATLRDDYYYIPYDSPDSLSKLEKSIKEAKEANKDACIDVQPCKPSFSNACCPANKVSTKTLALPTTKPAVKTAVETKVDAIKQPEPVSSSSDSIFTSTWASWDGAKESLRSLYSSSNWLKWLLVALFVLLILLVIVIVITWITRSASASYTSSPLVPGGIPAAQAAVPAVQAAVPAVQAAVPTVQAAVPSVQAAVPTVQSAVPSVQAAVPTVQAAVPSVQAAVPSVQAAVHGEIAAIENASPGMRLM